MTGELVPRSDLRMSDVDRERVVGRLQAAVGEGQLTLEEFEQRLDAVLVARTFAEVEPYVADLPAAPAPKESAQIRATSSGVKRQGQWMVPRQLSVFNKSSSVTAAVEQPSRTASAPVLPLALVTRRLATGRPGLLAHLMQRAI